MHAIASTCSGFVSPSITIADAQPIAFWATRFVFSSFQKKQIKYRLGMRHSGPVGPNNNAYWIGWWWVVKTADTAATNFFHFIKIFCYFKI
jgi:hypothetical protein